jgi:biopolymer transport protein ExbB/TolQ
MQIFREWYSTGGPTMTVLLLVALVGLAVAIERLYMIVIRSKNNGRAFIEKVITLVRSGRVDDAIKLCAQSKAALPDIGLLILRSRSRDEDDLHNVADAASLSVMPRLTRRLQYLPMLANVALLLGLLGTVIGMQRAFDAAGARGSDYASVVGSGVATALGATGVGIIVAIVLSLFHGYLASQAEGIVEQIDEFSVRLINALIDRPDVRLGHR